MRSESWRLRNAKSGENEQASPNGQRSLTRVTKSQVLALLGWPDRKTDLIGSRQRFIEATITCHLEPERGFIRIDSEALILEFDFDDEVSRQDIYRD